MNFRKDNRGISGVITMIVLITVMIATAAIVWGVISGLFEGELENIGSCINVLDKIEMNGLYTCYDSSNNFQFSISIGEVDIDEIFVSIFGGGVIKNYTLTNESQNIQGLGPYPSGSGEVVLPGKNSELTYISSEFASRPESIKIFPVIEGEQCEVVDSLNEIGNC